MNGGSKGVVVNNKTNDRQVQQLQDRAGQNVEGVVLEQVKKKQSVEDRRLMDIPVCHRDSAGVIKGLGAGQKINKAGHQTPTGGPTFS